MHCYSSSMVEANRYLIMTNFRNTATIPASLLEYGPSYGSNTRNIVSR